MCKPISGRVIRPDEIIFSQIYTDNDPKNVRVPFSWNAIDGYVLHSTHNHPNGMPPSIHDIFSIGFNARDVLSHPNLVASQKSAFMAYYTDVVEAGNGIFYAITVKDMDKLIAKTTGQGNTVSASINNLNFFLDEYRKLLGPDDETINHRIQFLLDYFGDSLNLYVGERDIHGNVKKFEKLNLHMGNKIDKISVACDE